MHISRFRRHWRWLTLIPILLIVVLWTSQRHLPPLLPATPIREQPVDTHTILAYGRAWENSLLITDFAERQVTTLAGIVLSGRPSWAPNGQQLAFFGIVHDPQGQQLNGLFTVALSDMASQPRFRAAFGGYELHWSPDGQTIAFTDFDHDASVFLLDVATDHVTEVVLPTATSIANLAWSPDSQYLALQATVNQDPWWQLVLLEPATRAVRYLASGTQPSWSPDSTELVYGHQSDLYTIQIVGSSPKRLTNTPELEREPYWSPNGEFIAFLGQEDQQWFGEPAWEDIPVGVYLLDVRTHAITPLTGVDATISILHGWSADSDWLVVNGSFPTAVGSGIAILAADGSGVQLVAPDGRDPTWRP